MNNQELLEDDYDWDIDIEDDIEDDEVILEAERFAAEQADRIRHNDMKRKKHKQTNNDLNFLFDALAAVEEFGDCDDDSQPYL